VNALKAAALMGGGEGISTAQEDKETLHRLTDSGKKHALAVTIG